MYLLRPASADLVIPMPGTGDLPVTGAVVPAVDLYWVRRVKDGDVRVDEVRAETVEEALAEIEAASTAKKKG
jgi:hypothetical protein